MHWDLRGALTLFFGAWFIYLVILRPLSLIQERIEGTNRILGRIEDELRAMNRK